MAIPTPHNSAKYGEIAKTVLMPGDPLRSQFIAENFLDNPVLVNNVRGVQGYTGTWKGSPVTVMASGMGIPSIAIYSWELFTEYGVENIIRVGSAGAIQDNIQVMDIVIAQGACTDSNYIRQFGLPGTFAPIADYTLLEAAVNCARKSNIKPHIGNLLSTDVFYDGHNGESVDSQTPWKGVGVLAVEMEAAGLYLNAARLGKRALAICTISDHLYAPRQLTAEERQTSFTKMIELSLDTAVIANNL